MHEMMDVARKEYLHIRRDRRTLILILVMPTLLTLLFGFAFQGASLTNIPTAFVDEDQTPESFRLADAFRSVDLFAVRDDIAGRDPAQEAMNEGKIKVMVIVPAGFSDRIKEGKSAALDVIVDGTDTNTGPAALEAAARIVEGFNARVAAESLRAAFQIPIRMGEALLNRVGLEKEVLFNPGLRNTDYLMPGIIGLILQLLTVMLMASSIAREREAGTMEQLVVSPLSRSALFLGKLIPYFVISLVNVVTVLFISWYGFDVPLGKNPLLLLALCTVFVVSSLATGQLISAVAKTQHQGTQIALFYLLPVFFLSGAYAPLESIPATVRPISYLFPLTYFSRSVRAVTLRDAGIILVGKDLLILSLFAVVMLYWAVITFKKRVA